MSLEGNYSYGGIGAAEAKDRENEHRSGVPPFTGKLLALLAVALKYLTGVRITNQGSADAHVALAHGGGTKTQTGELLTAFMQSATAYAGRLEFGSIVPGSFSTAAAAGPGALSDINPATGAADGSGTLYDAAGAVRGLLNYATGVLSITFSGAVTELVTATYQHTDWAQFRIGQAGLFTGTAYPFTAQLQFGRTVPGTVTLTDGALTFTDDGKGNMVETGAGFALAGTIDYLTGLIELTSGSAPLSLVADAVTVAYSFNPFAARIARGGGHNRSPLLPGALPEFDNEAWADGVKGESEVALLGQTTDPGASTNLVTYWSHHVGDDEGFRVREIYNAFPPGGHTNDPRVN